MNNLLRFLIAAENLDRDTVVFFEPADVFERSRKVYSGPVEYFRLLLKFFRDQVLVFSDQVHRPRDAPLEALVVGRVQDVDHGFLVFDPLGEFDVTRSFECLELGEVEFQILDSD